MDQYFLLLKLWLIYLRMFMLLVVMDELGVLKVLLIALKISFFSSDALRFTYLGGFSIYFGNSEK